MQYIFALQPPIWEFLTDFCFSSSIAFIASYSHSLFYLISSHFNTSFVLVFPQIFSDIHWCFTVNSQLGSRQQGSVGKLCMRVQLKDWLASPYGGQIIGIKLFYGKTPRSKHLQMTSMPETNFSVCYQTANLQTFTQVSWFQQHCVSLLPPPAITDFDLVLSIQQWNFGSVNPTVKCLDPTWAR